MRGTFRNPQYVHHIQQLRTRFARYVEYASTLWEAAFRDFFSVSGFSGAVGVMAKVIEFYIPNRFRPSAKWVPPTRRGQVIEFYVPKKSA